MLLREKSPALEQWLRHSDKKERQAIKTANAEALPKGASFIWTSVEKFKPKGAFENNGDFGGKQLG